MLFSCSVLYRVPISEHLFGQFQTGCSRKPTCTLPAGSLGGVPIHGVGYGYLWDLGKEAGKMALRPFGGRGFYDPYHEINRLLDEMTGGTAGLARRSDRQQGAAAEWAPAVDAL